MTTDLLGTYRTDGSDRTESQWSRIGRNAVRLGAIVHRVHSTNCPVNLTNLTLEASATTFPENQFEGKLSALFPLLCTWYCSDYVRSLILFSIHLTEESPCVWRHSFSRRKPRPLTSPRNGNELIARNRVLIVKVKAKSALLSILPHVPYIHTENWNCVTLLFNKTLPSTVYSKHFCISITVVQWQTRKII